MTIPRKLNYAWRQYRAESKNRHKNAAKALQTVRGIIATKATLDWAPAIYPKVYYFEPHKHLRKVGTVEPESSNFTPRNEVGWYTDPFGDTFRDGTGLCWGEVWQLPAHKGIVRFVPAFQFGGVDRGPDFLWSDMVTENCRGKYYRGNEPDGAHTAARIADSAAKNAAEKEREFQCAWLAGQRYADLADDISETRKATLDLIAEVKTLRGTIDAPHVCAALRATIAENIREIAAARRKRAELKAGNVEPFYFWHGDEHVRDAWLDATGESLT